MKDCSARAKIEQLEKESGSNARYLYRVPPQASRNQPNPHPLHAKALCHDAYVCVMRRGQIRSYYASKPMSGNSLKVSWCPYRAESRSYTLSFLLPRARDHSAVISRTTIFHGAETLIETRAGTSVTKSLMAGLARKGPSCCFSILGRGHTDVRSKHG